MIHAPGDFVNLAVELGLMDDITRLVLAETIDAIDRIDEGFGPLTPISVNVAAKQAGDFRFMRSFVEALDATGYPERFMVELTEEAFLHKSQFQTRILPMLRDVGAKISIDDFGVGYSSLSALTDITADEIKVDRSFITAIHRRPQEPEPAEGGRVAGRRARDERRSSKAWKRSKSSPTSKRRRASATPRAFISPGRCFLTKSRAARLHSPASARRPRRAKRSRRGMRSSERRVEATGAAVEPRRGGDRRGTAGSPGFPRGSRSDRRTKPPASVRGISRIDDDEERD